MWISEKLKEEKLNKTVSVAKAISGGEELTVMSDKEIRQPVVAKQYGFYSLIPDGANVIMCEDAVIGVGDKPQLNLLEGEACIYSKGGYILLKNNGDVIINGKKLTI